MLRSELGGNGSELDSELSGNRWSPYTLNEFQDKGEHESG